MAIPKNNVIDFNDFITNVDKETIAYFFDKILDIVIDLGLDKTGYRLVMNSGKNANQEVQHFHVHILGGENIKGIK